MRLRTALPGGNGGAVRAGLRVSQERTDAIRSFGREDVLELARLLLNFSLVINPQRFHKKSLRQPVPANYVLRALAAAVGEIQGNVPVRSAGCAIGMHQLVTTVQ